MIINWSVTLYGQASIYAPLALLDVLAGIWGLAVTIGSWLDFEDYPALMRNSNAFAWANGLVVLLLVAAWTSIQFHNNPSYSTDELSFDQYAAQLVAHGLNNPYVHSMAPAGPLFRLSPDAYTYTINGTPVKVLSYPALSFLIYVPFLLLGWVNELGATLDVAGWMGAIALMFWLLPRNLRPAVLLLSSLDVYLSFAVGGVTDMLYIPLLVIAAYKWDRFGESRRSYINPIALGLAMSIKQTPWPVLAFVLCALAWDEYDRNGNVELALRRVGRYLGVVLGIFLLLNLPYMIASPGPWFSGVFQPFITQMVPSGQGLIALTMYAHLGGGSLGAYTAVLVLVALLVLVVFVGTYPLLRPATFMLPSVFYFFAARSQTNYLISLIPVAIMGAVTAGPAAARRAPAIGFRMAGMLRGRIWMRTTAALSVAALAAIVYALTASSPLTLWITKLNTTGYLGGIRFLTLHVHNNSSGPLTPNYTIQTSHGDTTFWRVIKGPKTIRPGASAKVQIGERNYQAEPGLSDGFSVLAFTDRPEAVTVSHRFLLNLWRTVPVPQAFDKTQKIGTVVKLQIQLLNHYNSPVRQAGVKVYLGQALYTGFGERRASARIGTSLPGNKGFAYTNPQGVATFNIVGTRPATISFSAHLWNAHELYVFAGSGYVNITFVH